METLRRENQRLQARLTEIALRKSGSGNCSADASQWCTEDSKSADADVPSVGALIVSSPYSKPLISSSFVNDSIRSYNWDDNIQCVSPSRSLELPSNEDRDQSNKQEYPSASSSVVSRDAGQSIRSRQEDDNNRVMELVVRAVLEDKQADLNRSNCYQVLHRYAMSQVEIQRKTTALKLANLRISKMKREELARNLISPPSETAATEGDRNTLVARCDMVSVAVQTANQFTSFTNNEAEHKITPECTTANRGCDAKAPTEELQVTIASDRAEVDQSDPFAALLHELIWAIAFTFCLINLLHGPGAKKNSEMKEQKRKR